MKERKRGKRKKENRKGRKRERKAIIFIFQNIVGLRGRKKGLLRKKMKNEELGKKSKRKREEKKKGKQEYLFCKILWAWGEEKRTV